jgi:hypothetical protein
VGNKGKDVRPSGVSRAEPESTNYAGRILFRLNIKNRSNALLPLVWCDKG